MDAMENNSWVTGNQFSSGSQTPSGSTIVQWAPWIGGGLITVVGTIAGVSLLSANSKPANPKTFSLRAGFSHDVRVEFKKGVQAEIWVSSEHDSDVDVFVYDSRNRLVVKDEHDDRNCHVRWTPTETQRFKIVVANRIRLEPELEHRNRDNRCTLKWRPE